MKYRYTKEQLEESAKNATTIADICRDLNISPIGGNYKTIRKKIKEYDISIEHFVGSGWNKGDRFKTFGKKVSMLDILVENSSYTNSSHLRKRLIEEGYKRHQCEKCLNIEWLEQPISLELNHINGINNDHRLVNLELLCPNCHAQTSNYRGKNMQSYKNKMEGNAEVANRA